MQKVLLLMFVLGTRTFVCNNWFDRCLDLVRVLLYAKSGLIDVWTWYAYFYMQKIALMFALGTRAFVCNEWFDDVWT